MKNKTRNASLPLGSKPSSSGSPSGANLPVPRSRYAHYVIFITLFISSFFNLEALWGLLFIGWTLPAYRNREVFFLDMIQRNKEPKFYWLVFVTWIAFGVMMVLQGWSNFGELAS